MARQLCCGRRLLFCTRQSCINTGPTRRTGGPDRHRRAGKIWIVESPSSNEDQMRSCLSLAKERSAAMGAEPAVHSTATVGHTREVSRFSHDLERCRAKASANRSAACTQVLAIAAPAHSRGDWRFRALPANRAAKTPACHCHCALRGQERGFTPPRIVCLPACSNPAMPRTGNHGLSLWPKTRPSPPTLASRTTSPQEPTRSNGPTAGS